MKPQNFKDLLDRYAKGECTEEEEKLINEWYDAVGDTDDEQIDDAMLKQITGRKSMESALWSKINPRPAQVKLRPASNYFMRVAATLLILVVAGASAYVLLSDKSIDEQIVAFRNLGSGSEYTLTHVVTNNNEVKKITLPDESVVTLQANSEIRFPKNFKKNIRETYLTGEAFFSVKKDKSKPFVVYSNEVITKVLGTSFNIKAYSNEKQITVAVKTGKVSVYANTGHAESEDAPSVILTPNQEVVYDRENDKVVKKLVEKPEVILPEPTLFRMSYDGVPVTKIFEVLEENYGVDIEYDEEDLKACVLTTSMSDEGLYERIDIICKAINAEYTITHAVINIKSNGCY
jgi:transmembrane sensor